MPDGRVETQHLPEMKDDTARVEHAAGTFRRKHGDALTWEDVAQYRSSKVRVGLAIADPERHLGLRVSRLEDLAKGLVVDGHVELNDLGDNFEIRDDEYSVEPNTGYSMHSVSDARNHERPNHLRLFEEGWSRGRSRTGTRTMSTLRASATMERRNKQATQEFLSRWNDAENEARADPSHGRVAKSALVELRKGAVAAGVGVAVAGGFRQVPVPQSTPWLRFLSPLIEPDVPISGIRLSDQLHYRPTADTSVVTDVRGGRVPVLRTHARWRTAPFRAL